MIGNGDLNGLSIVGTMSIRHADAYTVNTTVADTYGQLSGFNKIKENLMTVNEVLGELIMQIDGTYKFDGVASLFPGSGVILHFAVFINGVLNEDIESGIDFKNSQDTQTFSGTGTLDLKKGDIVTVRGKTDTVPATITVNHMNINLFRIGH